VYLLNCFAFVGLIANIIYTQNFDFDRCLSCSAEQKRGPFWPPTWTHTVIDTRIYSVWDCVFNVEMLYRDLVCQQSVISYVIASYLYSVVLHAWTQECQHMMPCPWWWIPMTAANGQLEKTAGPPSQRPGHCSRKRMQQNKKNVKSHVFGFWKNVKNAKNVKVMTSKVLETTQSVFVL